MLGSGAPGHWNTPEPQADTADRGRVAVPHELSYSLDREGTGRGGLLHSQRTVWTPRLQGPERPFILPLSRPSSVSSIP